MASMSTIHHGAVELGLQQLRKTATFDWIIPNFNEWAANCPKNQFKRGPDFQLAKNLIFGLGCHPNQDSTFLTVWLEHRSHPNVQISVKSFRICLIDRDGNVSYRQKKSRILFFGRFRDYSVSGAGLPGV